MEGFYFKILTYFYARSSYTNEYIDEKIQNLTRVNAMNDEH